MTGPVVQGLPADGHGDDDRLPARIEKFSGGGDPPGYQHPQGAQCHKNRTHQWVCIVIVFCVGRKTLGSDNRQYNVTVACDCFKNVIFHINTCCSLKNFMWYSVFTKLSQT